MTHIRWASFPARIVLELGVYWELNIDKSLKFLNVLLIKDRNESLENWNNLAVSCTAEFIIDYYFEHGLNDLHAHNFSYIRLFSRFLSQIKHPFQKFERAHSNNSKFEYIFRALIGVHILLNTVFIS